MAEKIVKDSQGLVKDLVNDTISRQAAIEAINEDKIDLTNPNVVAVFKATGDFEKVETQVMTCDRHIEILKDLPSVQPEPCDDPRADIYYLAEKIGIHRLYALVVELRGEPEPCKDAVSRQAAIDELDKGAWGVEWDKTLAKTMIESLPSAQPTQNTRVNSNNALDTISRQAAIDALRYAQHRFTVADEAGGMGTVKWSEDVIYFAAAERILTELPSAQPEIIRCRDCKYYKDITSIHGECECGEMWQSLFGEVTEVEAIEVHKDHYCGYAERRTDERTD